MFIVLGWPFLLIIGIAYILYYALIVAGYMIFWCAFIVMFVGMGVLGLLAALTTGGIGWYRTRSFRQGVHEMKKGWIYIVSPKARNGMNSAAKNGLKGPRDWTPSR
jgi:hypothetical protein